MEEESHSSGWPLTSPGHPTRLYGWEKEHPWLYQADGIWNLTILTSAAWPRTKSAQLSPVRWR